MGEGGEEGEEEEEREGEQEENDPQASNFDPGLAAHAQGPRGEGEAAGGRVDPTGGRGGVPVSCSVPGWLNLGVALYKKAEEATCKKLCKATEPLQAPSAPRS